MKFTAVLSVLLAGGVALAAQTPAKQAPPKPTAAKTASAKAAPESKLPPAVAAAFKKAYPTATIKSASSEREGGKLQWEVESMDGATRRDLMYLPDGTLVVEELTIDAAAVPAPVMTALKARYPKATVSLCEKLTKPAAGVSYELQIKGAAVKEVEIAPDGTFISPKPVKAKK